MPSLKVQDYLRGGGSLEMLELHYGIKARRHGAHPNLVLLKYNQISSPFQEQMVRECRGVILDEAAGWGLVCLTYTKFFNHGESLAAEIDWRTARVYEKLDGSLIQLYHYAGEWRVATSGTPDAETPVGDFARTFSRLFWDTIDLQFGCASSPCPGALAGTCGRRAFTDQLDPDCCYAFELCSPFNRVVVSHERASLWLHGVRHRPSLGEESPEFHAKRIGVPVAPSYDLGDLDAVLRAAGELDPLAQEGYVVRDSFFNRVKVKSPAYVALHHAKDGLLSRRMMANTIRKGEAEELRTALSAFPELADEFRRLEQRHSELVFDAETVFAHIMLEQAFGRIGPSRKEFAAAATKDPRLSGVLFHLLDREAERGIRPTESTIREYFANLHEKAYMRLLGVKDEPAKEEIAA